MSRRATGGPRWMAIRDGASRRDRTRLTDGLADASTASRQPRRCVGLRSARSEGTPRRHPPEVSVLVRAERVGRRAGVADRRRRLEMAEGDRHAAVREEALHVVQPVGAALELDEAAERATLDPLRRQSVRVDVRRHDRERQSHGGWRASNERSVHGRSGGGR